MYTARCINNIVTMVCDVYITVVMVTVVVIAKLFGFRGLRMGEDPKWVGRRRWGQPLVVSQPFSSPICIPYSPAIHASLKKRMSLGCS